MTRFPVVETNVTSPGGNSSVFTLSNPSGMRTTPWMELTVVGLSAVRVTAVATPSFESRLSLTEAARPSAKKAVASSMPRQLLRPFHGWPWRPWFSIQNTVVVSTAGSLRANQR